jgi:hypothetical protein
MGNTLAQSIEEQAMERIQNIIRAYAAGKLGMERAWAKIAKITASTNGLLETRNTEKVLAGEVGELTRHLHELEEKHKAAQIASELAASNFKLHLNDE